MSLMAWTLLPLGALHLWFGRRLRNLLKFQLVLDLILLAILGPVLVGGGDLNPIRCIEKLPPFSHVEWSQSTEFQPTQSDLVLYFHPWWEAAGRALQRGEMPWIASGFGAGLPLLANGQTGLLAPVMLPVWLYGPERGTTIMAFWKIELAGLGAFLLFFRVWRLRWIAAAAGGVAWAGTPYLVAWLLVPLAWVAAALPWIWWLTWWGMRRRAPLWTSVVIGAVMGYLMGCGLHPETAAIVCGSALLMALVLHPVRWKRLLVIVGAAGLVTIGLSWPTVGYISASSRHALGADGAANRDRLPWSIQKDITRQIAVPASMGHPGRGDWKPQYPQAPGAAGVGGVVLALVAMGQIRRRYGRIALAAVATSAIGIILLVRIPPLDALLVRIPPLDQMTLPRFGVLIPWGLVVLAALALDGALRGRIRSLGVRLVPAAIIGIIALTTAPWHLQPSSIALVILSVIGALAVAFLQRRAVVPLLVAGELALLALGINPVAHSTDRLPKPALIERLQALDQQQPGRIIGMAGALPSNLAMRYGLRDLRASDPLRPKSFARLMGVLGEPKTILGGALWHAPANLCGAWGVGYAVTRPGKKLEGWHQTYSDADGIIWSNPQLLPEVRVVGHAIPEPENPLKLVTMIESVDFEFSTLVPIGTPQISATTMVLELGRRTSSRLEAVVECNGPCLLVLAQPWAPGWRATVDSRPTETVLTNIAGLGVAVPEGRHEIELSYHPWAW
ncbi:MAG: hypothetical protein DRJ61_03125 [Acidobacteria bacterium]|nr:MAG: hypothetical protein DRJ61_03125 [Acidobacteriota bacterium]